MESSPSGSARLPGCVRPLLWDVDPDAFDPLAYPVQVLERVLEWGTPDAYRWARALYGVDRLREFIRTDGVRRLSPRALNYWAFILDIGERECLVTSCLRNKGPLWIS